VLSDRGCVAGPAGEARGVADRVDAACEVREGRHVGQDPCHLARSGRCRGPDRLGGIGGLDDQPDPPARGDLASHHRGQDRTTRICWQANDSPVFPALLDHLRVAHVGPGRARTRPDRVRADKAYSSRSNRALLRARGIGAVIPEPSDQIRNRKRRSSNSRQTTGLRPDRLPRPQRVERSFNQLKHWRGLATRYDKRAVIDRGAAVLKAIFLCLKRLGDAP